MQAKYDFKLAYLTRRAKKRQRNAQFFEPIDAQLASLDLRDVLSDALLSVLDNRSALAAFATQEAAYGVSSLPLFKHEFSERLISTVEHIEARYAYLIERPNSMNNYGLVLQEFGFHDLFTRIVRQALEPIARVLFPEWLDDDAHLDNQHVFVVEYALSKDKDLDRHMDDALVTANVNLGKAGFEGGAVVFSGVR